MTQTPRGARSPCVVCAKRRRKDGARAMMTPKERLKVHAEIEKRNAQYLAWFKKGIRRKRYAKNRLWGVCTERGKTA